MTPRSPVALKHVLCPPVHTRVGRGRQRQKRPGIPEALTVPMGMTNFLRLPHILGSLHVFQTWFAKFLGHSFPALFSPKP